MPLSLFAMMDSVMTRPYAVRCGKSRPVVATRRVGALTVPTVASFVKRRRNGSLLNSGVAVESLARLPRYPLAATSS